MNKKVFIFVNGILTNPGDVNGWTDRAEAWIEQNTNHISTRFEYFSGALTRRIFQTARVRKLEDIAKKYLGDKLILVGHSNGCDIIERFVRRGIYKVHEAHLIAAASEGDFDLNGYNEALKKEKVGKVFVYYSANDKALQKAQFTRSFLKYLGLGYGYMGLTGPMRVNPAVIHKVKGIEWGVDHSEWLVPTNFDKIMSLISGYKV